MAQDDYIRTALRLPPELHAAIHASSDEAGTSFNSEIIGRLQAVQHLRQENASLRAEVAGLQGARQRDHEQMAEMRANLRSLYDESRQLHALVDQRGGLLAGADEQKAQLTGQIARLSAILEHERDRANEDRKRREVKIAELEAALTEAEERARSAPAPADIDRSRRTEGVLAALQTMLAYHVRAFFDLLSEEHRKQPMNIAAVNMAEAMSGGSEADLTRALAAYLHRDERTIAPLAKEVLDRRAARGTESAVETVAGDPSPQEIWDKSAAARDTRKKPKK